MQIQHLRYPFYHTIIYNYFDEEYQSIYDECKYITSTQPLPDFTGDNHHTSLVKQYLTKPFLLDTIYEGNREGSSILQGLRKIYGLNLKENPFSGYIPVSNFDLSFLVEYKNGSSYFKHKDLGILTFLYTVWDEPKTWTGGDLVFTNYDYRPYLRNNCCLIFPSFELHEVETLRGEGARYTINQRIYIK
jgi:hypothetical protein